MTILGFLTRKLTNIYDCPQFRLKARHFHLMAFGGAVGTGLFLSIGIALSRGGPLSVFMSYTITGLAVYSVVSDQFKTAHWPILTSYVDARLGRDGHMATGSRSHPYVLQPIRG